jgi:molecular chaperone HtpG
MSETYQFQAEINQLMNLIINAFYSNKDIYLRELVSNASDAISKSRYQNLQNGVVGKEYEIRLSFNKNAKTFTIEDNGIGMDRQGLITNLGTIAHSNTREFLEKLKQNDTKNNDLIGSFGMGFYSSFLVADNVTVISKVENGQCYRWSSSANGEYTVDELEQSDLFDQYGTKIVLQMKESELGYLDEKKVKDIIKTHSQFITYPIKLLVTKVDEIEEDSLASILPEVVPKPLDATTESEQGPVIEEVNDDETTTPAPKKKVKVERHEWEHLNMEKPIWCKNSSEITEDEYKTLCKSLTNESEYLCAKHFAIEGDTEFRGILYFPARAPHDMFGNNQQKKNIKLFVKKVFISDECKEMSPDWTAFVYGIVDSNDLPLNVSREMLQQNRTIKTIRKHIVKKIFEMLEDIREDDDKYEKFYKNFSKNLKYGAHEDSANREKFCKYLRYFSTTSPDKMISFDDYIGRMKENQNDIYYVIGTSMESIKQSIFLERLVKNGYEVLYMVDAIDEYMMQSLKKYSDKNFVNISTENLKLDDETDDTDNKEETNKLCERMKSVLGNKVEKVVVSTRITDSPACLVTGSFGWSANMERIMKSQALYENPMSQFMISRRTMEINAKHPIIINMMNTHDEVHFGNMVNVVHDVAKMASGFTIENPSEMANRFFKIIEHNLNDDSVHDCDYPHCVHENADECNNEYCMDHGECGSENCEVNCTMEVVD